MSKPIPVFGVPKCIQPDLHIKIPLWWHPLEGVNWCGQGEVCTRVQLEEAILKSAGCYLPNNPLPALDPGDCLILAEGLFWLDSNWKLCAVDASWWENSSLADL